MKTMQDGLSRDEVREVLAAVYDDILHHEAVNDATGNEILIDGNWLMDSIVWAIQNNIGNFSNWRDYIVE